jgi:hypothetical protein
VTRRQAVAAIKAILESIDDKSLPKPTEIEERDGRTIIWFGGQGFHVGSTKDGWGPKRGDYRVSGVSSALEHEVVHRAEQRLWDEWEKTKAEDARVDEPAALFDEAATP